LKTIAEKVAASYDQPLAIISDLLTNQKMRDLVAVSMQNHVPLDQALLQDIGRGLDPAAIGHLVDGTLNTSDVGGTFLYLAKKTGSFSLDTTTEAGERLMGAFPDFINALKAFDPKNLHPASAVFTSISVASSDRKTIDHVSSVIQPSVLTEFSPSPPSA